MEITRTLTVLTVAASTLLSIVTVDAQITTIDPVQSIAPPPDATPVPQGETYLSRTDVDRNTLLVAPSFGRAAYVYTRPSKGQPWTYAAELVAPEGFVAFNDVALHGDTAVMSIIPTDGSGNFMSGTIHVFTRGAAGWEYRQSLTEPASSPERPEFFGYRVDLSRDTLAIPNFIGAVVYVYERGAAGDFEFVQELRAENPQLAGGFGFDVAIDRRTMVVGASGNAAHVFTRTGSGWVQTDALLPPPTTDAHGFAEEVAVDGRIAVVSAPWADMRDEPYFRTGTAFIYRRSGGDWALEAQLSDPIENSGLFGAVVEVRGEQVIVNAWGRPLATNALTERLIVFEREHGTWQATASMSREGEFGFGYVVSWSGKDLIATIPAMPNENPVFEGELLHFVIQR